MVGDMEDSTVISHMSHVSVESARTGSWSGSAVGGFGFVDYPAGIPPKQWVSRFMARVVAALTSYHRLTHIFLLEFSLFGFLPSRVLWAIPRSMSQELLVVYMQCVGW